MAFFSPLPHPAMNEVYVIDACRTAIGKHGGALSGVRPDDLLAHILRRLLARNPAIPPADIEEVISGAANQAGEDNRNVARTALLLAGIPVTTAAVTVNRLCASGLEAIIQASRAIRCGDGDLYIACGVESMSRAPYVMAKPEKAFDRQPTMYDTTLGWRFVNPRLAALHAPISMGETAENLAEQYHISREAQDAWAFQTQLRYQQAKAANRFDEEIEGIVLPAPGEETVFDTDEFPRLSSPETLATLKPAFKKGGTVTAGNASGINDGAVAVLLASEAAVKRYGLTPIARVVSHAVAGVPPEIMGIGPVPATRKALERAGLSVSDIDLTELNEAFAAQVLACLHDLPLNPEQVNVNGGAIALGHPLGCSGARIFTTLTHELRRRETSRYGLATMCVGVGQGSAVIIERL